MSLLTYQVIINLNLQQYIVKEECGSSMTKLADEPTLGLHILFADTLHDGLDLALGVCSPSQQRRMPQGCFVLPAGVQTIPASNTEIQLYCQDWNRVTCVIQMLRVWD